MKRVKVIVITCLTLLSIINVYAQLPEGDFYSDKGYRVYYKLNDTLKECTGVSGLSSVIFTDADEYSCVNPEGLTFNGYNAYYKFGQERSFTFIKVDTVTKDLFVQIVPCKPKNVVTEVDFTLSDTIAVGENITASFSNPDYVKFEWDISGLIDDTVHSTLNLDSNTIKYYQFLDKVYLEVFDKEGCYSIAGKDLTVKEKNSDKVDFGMDVFNYTDSVLVKLYPDNYSSTHFDVFKWKIDSLVNHTKTPQIYLKKNKDYEIEFWGENSGTAYFSGYKKRYLGIAQKEITVPKASGEILVKVSDARIFPNPFNNVLQICAMDYIMPDVIIYDMKGAVVFRDIVNTTVPDSSIDLSELESGVYILRLEDGEKVFHCKVIKQ